MTAWVTRGRRRRDGGGEDGGEEFGHSLTAAEWRGLLEWLLQLEGRWRERSYFSLWC